MLQKTDLVLRANRIAPALLLATAILVIASVAISAGEPFARDAHAAAGSYVDSVTFTKQDNPDVATDALVAGDIHMYYQSISGENTQKVLEGGHNLYKSSSGTSYYFEVNPTDDHTNGFNPFAYQGVRLAINYIVDRDRIVSSLFESGSVMYSAIPPHHPDYVLVYKDLESRGFEHDLEAAADMIRVALAPSGAIQSSDNGKWHYNGEQITVKIFIRDDDRIRYQIGHDLADALQRLGFGVDITYGNLADAFAITATNPALQEWHLYTGASSFSGYAEHDNTLLGYYYAPWRGFMPGGNVEGHWNYENDRLDSLTREIYLEQYAESAKVDF